MGFSLIVSFLAINSSLTVMDQIFHVPHYAFLLKESVCSYHDKNADVLLLQFTKVSSEART